MSYSEGLFHGRVIKKSNRWDYQNSSEDPNRPRPLRAGVLSNTQENITRVWRRRYFEEIEFTTVPAEPVIEGLD